jgi:serine/threonine protein kinase
MLQVGEGMKYLHSMGLVHRDLKTDNILIKCDGRGSESSMLDPAVKPVWIAKISDFSTTKVKMDSTAYANQTMNTGSIMFMAPEMYRVERAEEWPERFHPKKTDVYSFGLICFAVLIGEPTPFPVEELTNPTPTAFKDRVREGKRPELPPYCPSQLSSLIQQCWDANPDERPNFQDICTKLRHIKGLLLTGMIICNSTIAHCSSNAIQYYYHTVITTLMTEGSVYSNSFRYFIVCQAYTWLLFTYAWLHFTQLII